MKRLFTLVLSVFVVNAFSQSTTVVISQVYGGGGATSGTPTYKPDYVELHNLSLTSQDISGFQVMYGAATGQFGSSASNYYVIPSGTIIPARKYLLIQCGTVGSTGVDLPVTPDLVTTNMNMSGANGKVALVTAAYVPNSCGATATPCTLPSATIIDLVAYGTVSNAEGGTAAAVPVLTTTTGAVRKLDGNQDTDNNAADFDVVTNPVPRNSASLAPLSLKAFSASLVGGKASLVWSTSNEINVKGFSVERSADGRNFSEAGFVKANNATSNQYSFNDAVAITGTTYFRLKMTDKDGSFKYSQTVVLNSKKSIKLEVYPNPVSNTITLSHTKADNTASIKIVTVEGKTIATYNVQVGATQTSIDATKLTRGNYLVVFENEGAKSTSQFIKQ
jgi:hypothetical protein